MDTDPRAILVGAAHQIETELNQTLSSAAFVRRFELLGDYRHLRGAVVSFATGEGKRFRPLLLMACHALFAERSPSSAVETGATVVQAAVAMELLHTFMLIHDDVIDRSDLRRGQATLRHALREMVGGRDPVLVADSLSIVVGDIVLSMAVELLNGLDVGGDLARRIVQATMSSAIETGFGQLLDVLGGSQAFGDVTLESVLRCYELKTARYSVELPMVLGAMMAGAESPDLTKLAALASALGIAYQLNDDLVGVTTVTSEKSGTSDFEEGRQTALLLFAHEGAAPDDQRWLAEHFGGGEFAAHDGETLSRIYRDSGAVEEVQRLIAAKIAEAQVHRLDLGIDGTALGVLLERLLPTSAAE